MAEETLEDEELAEVDRDEEVTDPQVNASELLSRMGFLSC